MQAVTAWLAALAQQPFAQQLSGALRYVFPVLAVWVLSRCGRSLLQFKKEPEIWAWLATPAGDRLPVTHWENLLGRGRGCDVQLEYPTISRQHAVLTRYDDGSWSVSDIGSKGGVEVNGEPVSFCALEFGDIISLGGVTFTLVPITKEQEAIQAQARTRAGRAVRPGVTLVLLTVFQLLCALQLMLHMEQSVAVGGAFLALAAMQWLLFLAQKLARRSGFDVETLAFFLTTVGLAVVSSSAPDELKKNHHLHCGRAYRFSGRGLVAARSGAREKDPLSCRGGGHRAHAHKPHLWR